MIGREKFGTLIDLSFIIIESFISEGGGGTLKYKSDGIISGIIGNAGAFFNKVSFNKSLLEIFGCFKTVEQIKGSDSIADPTRFLGWIRDAFSI